MDRVKMIMQPMLTDSSPSDSRRFIPFNGASLRPAQIPTPARAGDHLRFGAEHQSPAKSVDRFSDGLAREITGPRVEISPASAVTRLAMTWDGMAAEVVETMGQDEAEYRLKGPVHLLAVCDQGQRRAGETFVEGLPRSALRDLTGKISIVPAGREYHERHEPRGLTRTIFVYLDPAKLPALDPLTPRLHFQDALLHALALRLRRIVEAPVQSDRTYLQALGLVIANELQRLDRAPPGSQPLIRGGLAAWQERVVAEHIEEHLAKQMSLAQLAQLARLSPYHFARAFKQSFGLPPHRYHVMRRIEHAKTLLAKSAMSVTEIGLAVGFSETSTFTSTFRKLTGVTPTAYSRREARPTD
jgi:AraC family transcriptional regulator